MNNPARLSLVKWKPEEDEPLTAAALRQRLQTHAAAVSTLADDWATRDEPVSFKDFEQAIRQLVFAFARIAIMLFLALREDQLMRTYPSQVEREGRRFRRAPAIPRSLTTLFGVVRYARTYMREVGHHARRGFHPLDVGLGLVGDRFSWNLLTMAARLATKLSFAEARATLASFVPDAPSTEVIENTVLGLGRHTAAWFEQAPAPEGDGEVLIAMFDSKGAPTATESELSRRRGKQRCGLEKIAAGGAASGGASNSRRRRVIAVDITVGVTARSRGARRATSPRMPGWRRWW